MPRECIRQHHPLHRPLPLRTIVHTLLLGLPVGMLYTSDHGENIYDDNRKKFLHASPNPSEYELRVPLLAWTSTSYRSAYPVIISALRSNSFKPASNSISMFHTMLEVGGIRTKNLDLTKSLADRDYKVQPRLYLTDHNEAVEIECH